MSKKITPGSIVKTNYSFLRERNQFGYNYPTSKDLLTVGRVEYDEWGNPMLWFVEAPLPIPLAAICFDEVQDALEGNQILNEVFDILNGIC